MRRTVGPEDIKIINEAYLACGTYSGAAKATGWSASTVKKYIIPNFKSEHKVEAADIELPPFETIFNNFVEQAGSPILGLLELSKQERDEMKELWKEILV